jgi:hypothetical protein
MVQWNYPAPIIGYDADINRFFWRWPRHFDVQNLPGGCQIAKSIAIAAYTGCGHAKISVRGIAMQNLAGVDVPKLKIARPIAYRQIFASILLFAVLAFIVHACRITSSRPPSSKVFVGRFS